MIGKQFKIIPYCKHDGIRNMADSELATLFYKMKKDGTLSKCFPAGDVTTANEFVKIFKNKNNQLYLVFVKEKLSALGWLSDFRYSSALVHFCIFKELWGCEYLSNLLNWCISWFLNMQDDDGYILNNLLGQIVETNKLALKLTRKTKMKEIGRLEKMIGDKNIILFTATRKIMGVT